MKSNTCSKRVRGCAIPPVNELDRLLADQLELLRPSGAGTPDNPGGRQPWSALIRPRPASDSPLWAPACVAQCEGDVGPMRGQVAAATIEPLADSSLLV